MPRKKKSGSGGIIGAAVIGLLALIAAVPREVWVGAAVLAVIGVAIYLYSKSRSAPAQGAALGNEQPARPLTVRRTETLEIPAQRAHSRAPESMVGGDEPFAVGGAATPPSSSFRIPSAPAGFGKAKWIPAGEPVNVSGRSIPGGLIYVGTELKTPSGANDPCLIDPSKSVATQGDYTERQMGYWPSYSEISATARRAYLNWLAGGRKDPEADIGYVFIFFYGLERRAILDAAKDDAAKADWPVIATELRRLLDIYGEKSGSFRSYAGSLLDWVSLAEHPEKAYLKPIPSFPKSYELPLYIRVALGQAVLPWTVNRREDMARLMDLGVDGLITDEPDVLRALMRERGLKLPRGLKN